jgi:hypothetical protein
LQDVETDWRLSRAIGDPGSGIHFGFAEDGENVMCERVANAGEDADGLPQIQNGQQPPDEMPRNPV